MPTANIDFIPPEIPGLRFNQTTPTGGTVSGSVDALSVLGIDVPSRIETILLPPSNTDLYPFQREGVRDIQAMLKIHGGALLADDMGLGKTRQATSAVGLLKSESDTVLIVCPAGVRHQWVSEIVRQNVHLKMGPANLGPQSKKEYKAEWERWAGKAEWATVSYNLMAKALDTKRPSIIIFDEPHNYLQSRGSTYNKAIWKHKDLIRYKLALTGTPYLAKPAGMWSILYILLGMRFGKARPYDIRYCNGHQGQWGWKNDGATNVTELADRLKFYMVRRMKSEVLKDMPKVTRTVRWVEGTKSAQNAMLQMDHTINGMTKAQEHTLTEKFDEVIEVASSASGPTVTFTWLKEHADELASLFNKAKLPAIAIHGDWEAGVRARMVKQAQENKLHVVTTYGASATGLDGLQHFSSNAIFHSINPVPAITLQAIDRLNRIGQTEPVIATFIAMKDSVDELVVDRVISRLDIFGQILGRDKSVVSLSDALRNSGLSQDEVMDEIFKSLT